MGIATTAKVSKGIDIEKLKELGIGNVTPKPKYEANETGAMREKLSAPRYDYMPAKIVNEAYARVATFGAQKYEDRNWERGLPQSQIAGSLQRHLWYYMDGIETDPESGLSHLDHLLWNAVALLHHKHHGLCDDRMPIKSHKVENNA